MLGIMYKPGNNCEMVCIASTSYPLVDLCLQQVHRRLYNAKRLKAVEHCLVRIWTGQHSV